jgi:hypothetical protein
MKKIIKEVIVPLLIIWITISGFNVYYVHYVVQQLDFGFPISRGKPPVSLEPEIENFRAKTFGDPCVGDTIEILAEISNIYNEKIIVDVHIKNEAIENEKLIYEKTLSLRFNKTKSIKCDYILKKGGKQTFSLYYVLNGEEHLGDSFLLDVKSFIKDTHFAVTYFHYNLQFYCGNDESEKHIIDDLIRNLLEFYLENSQYKFTFEIQSYAIEVMNRDYPDVLDMIRELTERGQMELVVTHYSDQFFIAYPELDLIKSIKISDEILEKNDLKRSNVFGAQEWQWSPILPEVMRKYGYNIFIGRDRDFRRYYQIDEDFYEYQQNCLWKAEWNDESAYLFLDKPASIDSSSDEKTLHYEWAYHGDGEPLNSVNPTGVDFEFKPSKQGEFEKELKKYEDNDYKFVTASELVYTALEKGLEAEETEPIVDFAQQDTYVWMGRNKNNWEDDNYVNTLRYKARTSLLSAEALVDVAEENGFDTEDEKDTILELWKELLLSEVTDSTGGTPKQIEVKYSKQKARKIVQICEEVVFNMTRELDINSEVVIDTESQNIYENFDIALHESIEIPINFSVNCDIYSYECYNYSDSLYLLEIRLNATRAMQREIIFNYTDVCYYSPMGVGYLNAAHFSNKTPFLTLANGWTYLGNNVSIIKDCTIRHVGVEINQTVVKFTEDNLEGEILYRFYIYFGDMEDSLAFANRLNVNPCVISSDITQVILTKEMVGQ